MSEESDARATDSEPAPPKAVGQEKTADQPLRAKPETGAVVPEIAAYLANPGISPSAFLKALRANKVKSFKKEDEQRALSVIEDDTSGERLWALMSQANLPDVVEHWIWPVARDRLKSAVGPDFNPNDTNPSHILQNLRKALAPRLRSKEKIEARGAENWLRIGICWLVERRSIQLWTVAEVISTAFFADSKKAKSLVHRTISKGRTKDLKVSVATVTLGNDLVARSKSEMAEERQVSNTLRIKLTDAEKGIERLSAELAATRAELAQKDEALKNLETQLEEERYHWGYDLSETKAGQRVLLVERVAPLLSDALDALEIEPPVPDIAIRRIKAVLKIVDEANS